jgi:hypothetical protein
LPLCGNGYALLRVSEYHVCASNTQNCHCRLRKPFLSLWQPVLTKLQHVVRALTTLNISTTHSLQEFGALRSVRVQNRCNPTLKPNVRCAVWQCVLMSKTVNTSHAHMLASHARSEAQQINSKRSFRMKNITSRPVSRQLETLEIR